MNKKKIRDWGIFSLFVGPTFLAFLLIVVVPFMKGIYYSFTDWNGVTGSVHWIGLHNYALLVQDSLFLKTFVLTAKFTFFAVLLTNAAGFALALLVTQKLKLRNLYRGVFFMPNLIGGLLLGFIWQFIFTKGFSAIGSATGIPFFNLPWLGTGGTAFWGMVIVSVWQSAGYMMIIYIAALQNVPQDITEAAKVDGANSWNVIRHVVFPMIAPAVTVCTFLTLNNSFKVFDVNLSLTNGGPYKSTEMLALNIYNETFLKNNYGLGSAKAVVFFLVVALITVIQVYATKKREVEV